MIFLRAFFFGVTLAIAIGPIALLIIRYAAADGFRAGLASAGGAALADLTYAIVAVTVGAAIAPLLTAHAKEVQLVAAVTLIAFGVWLIWTGLRSQPAATVARETPNGTRHGLAPLVTTYALTAANPLTVVAFLAFIGQLPLDATAATRAVAVTGLFAGSLGIQIMLALIGVLLGRALTAGRSMQMLNVLSGIGIVLFGIAGL